MNFNERFMKKFKEKVSVLGTHLPEIFDTLGFSHLEESLGKKTIAIIGGEVGGEVGRELGNDIRLNEVNKMTSGTLSPIVFLINKFKEYMLAEEIPVFYGFSTVDDSKLFIQVNDCILKSVGNLCSYSTEFLREYLKAYEISKICTIKNGALNCIFELNYNQSVKELTKDYFIVSS